MIEFSTSVEHVVDPVEIDPSTGVDTLLPVADFPRRRELEMARPPLGVEP